MTSVHSVGYGIAGCPPGPFGLSCLSWPLNPLPLIGMGRRIFTPSVEEREKYIEQLILSSDVLRVSLINNNIENFFHFYGE